MCGICGFFTNKQITEEQLRVMNDEMIRRGPDDAGVEIYDAGAGDSVGLAQRRLAIIDLSPLGHQPMHSADGRLSVVFNGEIYNFGELRKELEDYPFRSRSDTEIILAAFEKWGESAVDRLGGMFAFAVYDRAENRITIARDRIGKKPLYYWFDGTNLVFASELRPIMRCLGFPRRVRRDILSRYLYQQYIDAPETVFEDVYKLEPGAVLTFRRAKDGTGDLSVRKYWSIRDAWTAGCANEIKDYAEAKEGLKTCLTKAVRERMIADVPLGSFLSGGYDSSLVSAVAQSILDRPLKTFSIGFEEAQYDESGYAREVARHLGTDHTELVIGEQEMLDLADSLADCFDEPFADSSQIPTMLVSKLARKDVTVALSGDGGDEFFCGYGIYRRVQQAQRLDALGAAVHLIGQIPAGGGKLEDKYPLRLRVISANRDKETKTQFGAGSYAAFAERFPMQGDGIKQLPVNYPSERSYGAKDWQVTRMLLDMDHYLPGDILCKVDRASMFYSLEARCPILDKDVMEYSFRIPHAFKYKGGEGKAILKDVAYDYIPRQFLDRPKKGFSVPLDKWLRGPLREQLTDFASRDMLRAQGLFDADYAAGFVENYLKTGDAGAGTGANYSRICWAFFVFQQWYNRFMV